MTLGRLSADGDAVLFAALANVLHQDLHHHCKVFFGKLHLPDTAQPWLDSAEVLAAAAVAGVAPTFSERRTPCTWTPGML